MRGRRYRIPKALLGTVSGSRFGGASSDPRIGPENHGSGLAPPGTGPRVGGRSTTPARSDGVRGCQPSRSVLGDLVTRFDDLIEVFLECPLLVTDEAEDMVQREPLDVGRVLVKISADTVQFGEEFFRFHSARAYQAPARRTRVRSDTASHRRGQQSFASAGSKRKLGLLIKKQQAESDRIGRLSSKAVQLNIWTFSSDSK